NAGLVGVQLSDVLRLLEEPPGPASRAQLDLLDFLARDPTEMPEGEKERALTALAQEARSAFGQQGGTVSVDVRSLNDGEAREESVTLSVAAANAGPDEWLPDEDEPVRYLAFKTPTGRTLPSDADTIRNLIASVGDLIPPFDAFARARTEL